MTEIGPDGNRSLPTYTRGVFHEPANDLRALFMCHLDTFIVLVLGDTYL